MAQTRLVEVRQGGSTTVRDFRRYARASTCCPACWCARGNLDPAVARSILEARLVDRPRRRRARRRAGWPALWPPSLDRHRRRAGRRPTTTSSARSTRWRSGTRSSTPPTRSTFRLMFNSLRAAYEPALEALAPLMAEEVGQIGAYRVLTAAIGEGDPDTARAAAERVLRPATAHLLAALDRPRGGRHDQGQSPTSRQLAAERLAADEAADHRLAAAASSPSAGAWRAFWRHPSPWMISTVPGRLGRRPRRWSAAAPGGSWLIPAALVALFPVIEWVIHVGILHWRPRRVGRRPRSTRCSPASTASTTPTRATSRSCSSRGRRCAGCCRRTSWWRCWRCRRRQRAARLLVSVYGLKFGYEWTHYLVHSDYRPRSRVVPVGVAQPPAAPLQERALLVHGHHRRHRRPAFGTYPEPSEVAPRRQPTVKASCTRRRASRARSAPRAAAARCRSRTAAPRAASATPRPRAAAGRSRSGRSSGSATGSSERLREARRPASPGRCRSGRTGPRGSASIRTVAMWSPNPTANAGRSSRIVHRVRRIDGRQASAPAAGAERVVDRDAAAPQRTSPPRARRPARSQTGSFAHTGSPSSAVPDTTRWSSAITRAPASGPTPARPRGSPRPAAGRAATRGRTRCPRAR